MELQSEAREIVGLRADIEGLSTEYKGLQGQALPMTITLKPVKPICSEESACFKTLEVTSFEDSTINSFSTILQEEI